MSELYFRVLWLSSFLFFSFILYTAMDSMYCDFSDIVLATFVLFAVFLFLYIVFDNARQSKKTLFHPKNITVLGASIILCAFFRSMEKGGIIDENHVFIFYIFTNIAAFVLNLTVFSSDNYIPPKTPIKKKNIANTMEREIIGNDTVQNIDGDDRKNWFDFDVFDKEKYEIYISYHAKYFGKREKDVDIYFSKNKNLTFIKDNWYYAEIANKPIRDYYFAENPNFDDFLLDLCHKNSQLIQSSYMCTYKVHGWNGIVELCEKISAKSLEPKVNKWLYFDETQIEDFAEKVCSMKGVSENVRTYFKWQFKGDIDALKKCKIVRFGNKEMYHDNSLVLNIKGKAFAIIKKSNKIEVEIL